MDKFQFLESIKYVKIISIAKLSNFVVYREPENDTNCQISLLKREKFSDRARVVSNRQSGDLDL